MAETSSGKRHFHRKLFCPAREPWLGRCKPMYPIAAAADKKPRRKEPHKRRWPLSGDRLTIGTPILGIIKTAAINGIRRSQFNNRFLKNVETSVQVSAERKPSFGLR